MFDKNLKLINTHILAFVACGTVLRLLYGLLTKTWNMAQDQAAWSLSLQEMLTQDSWAYKQLIHYPFEGGTYILSLLAVFFMTVSKSIPALSLAVLIADSFCRFFQIFIAKKIFGSYSATWFAIWTVFALPVMIPTGSSYFGLHSLSSVFPFVFIFFCLKTQDLRGAPIAMALVVALSLMFSYNNIIFFPVYLVWVFFSRQLSSEKLLVMMRFCLALLMFMLPHIIIRLSVDQGFNLQEFTIVVLRKTSWTDMTLTKGLMNHCLTWVNTLPASLFVSSFEFLSPDVHRIIGLIFISSALGLLLYNKSSEKPAVLLGLLIVLVFLLSYSFSIFFVDDISQKSFHFYRHFCYIIPLLVSLFIFGFSQAKKFTVGLLSLWTGFCFLISVAYFISSPPSPPASHRVIGWILAGKYGEDPPMLLRIQELSPTDQKNELMFGYGWGLAAHVLRGKTLKDSAEVIKLHDLHNQFPAEYQKFSAAGIYFAFAPRITPPLDRNLVPVLNRYIPETKVE